MRPWTPFSLLYNASGLDKFIDKHRSANDCSTNEVLDGSER